MATNPREITHISASQIDDYQQELTIAREKGDRLTQATALANTNWV